MQPVYYNPSSNKIVGAKKNSFLWWHERGHQVLQEQFSYYTYRDKALKTFLILTLIFIIKESFTLSVLFLFLYAGYPLLDEIFAWAYAITNYKKKES